MDKVKSRVLKPLEQMTFADDFIFCEVMSKPEIAKAFIEALYEKEVSKITAPVKQSTVMGEYGKHGVRFDVEFVGDDIVYDIEMQQVSSSGAALQEGLFCRTRYYQAMLDSRYLKQGKNYRELPRSRIIFIITGDLFDVGFAQYTQVPYIRELGVVVDNLTEVLYLNAKYLIDNVPEDIRQLLDYIRTDGDAVGVSRLVANIDAAVEDVKVDSEVRRSYMSLDEMISKYKEDITKEHVENLMRGLNVDRATALRLITGKDSNSASVDKLIFDNGR